jgi:hypothetical protein
MEGYVTPEERYRRAWSAYVDQNEVTRADASVICDYCGRTYRVHLQPLKEDNPTIRILCTGKVVKL